jgi:hypothetical protein
MQPEHKKRTYIQKLLNEDIPLTEMPAQALKRVNEAHLFTDLTL